MKQDNTTAGTSTKSNLVANRHAMARATGISVSHVSRVLSGDREPSLHTLTVMAKAAGVGIEQMVGLIGSSRAQAHKRRRVKPVQNTAPIV